METEEILKKIAKAKEKLKGGKEKEKSLFYLILLALLHFFSWGLIIPYYMSAADTVKVFVGILYVLILLYVSYKIILKHGGNLL